MFVFNLYLLQMVIPAMLILLPQYQMIQWFCACSPVRRGRLTVDFAVASIVLINIKGTALSTMIFTAAIRLFQKTWRTRPY